MEPFYQDSHCILYHGDCANVLPQLGRFDCLVTDPPYGVNVLATGGNVAGDGNRNTIGGRNYVKRGNKGTSKVGWKEAPAKEWEYKPWDDRPPEPWLMELVLSKADSHIVIGGNYFALPPSRGWLVWDKRNEGTKFADCELIYTNIDMACRKFAYRWNGMLQEKSGRNKDLRVHPTQKPLALMRWCLGFVPKAKTIIDPFAGSGTTLLAAKLEGRFCVGVEADPSYCEKIVQRLRQGVLTGLDS